MGYQVFARRLRPGAFDGLVGQEHVVRALSHGLDQGRLHHAYLFTGTRGVGKTTIARILAKCFNCEKGVSASPCGECSACLEISEGRFVDLIEVDAASRTKVDDTRELLDNVQYLPARGRYKVYLIDEVHMLSTQSFNALLKTLEEPPEHVKFLLATTDPKKVPVTVLSRCLQFQLKNLLPEVIRDYLRNVFEAEKIEFEEGALEIIARVASGSMRDALSIADQAVAYGEGKVLSREVSDMLGCFARGELTPLLEGLAASDSRAVLDFCDEMAASAVDFQEVLKELLSAFHSMAVIQGLGQEQVDRVDAEQTIVDLATRFDAETVQLYYQITLMGLRDLALAPDPRCGFEMVMLRMLTFQPESPSTTEPPGASRSHHKPRADAVTGAAVKSGPTRETQQRAKAPQAVRSPRVSQVALQPETSSPSALDIDWYTLVAGLSAQGVTRMIAEHSYPMSIGEDQWQLALDPDHDTLLNENQKKKLEKLLREVSGQPLTLLIHVTRPPCETPYQRNTRVQRERKQHAIEVLEADENVRVLLKEFDGVLNVESIESIDGEPISAEPITTEPLTQEIREQEAK